jgi:agmatine/peptidylarginine deiminase
MITDSQTNFVYLADTLKSQFPDFARKLITILIENNVQHDFLPLTHDIWARDFMPIQVSEDKFIEYRYDPDYLQTKKYRKQKTYPDIVCDKLGLKTIKTDLIIDGGNVIKSSNCVIMTDKVLMENKDFYKPAELIEKLKLIFEVEKIALIPWDKENEEFGHADGMIRFIDDNTVLLQGYFDEYDEIFKQKLYSSLEQNGLHWKKLKYDVETPDEENNWAYMNFLQTKDLILIPGLGIDEDGQALKQIKEYFPDYAKNDRVKQIDVSEIIEGGGALNCISWTIFKDESIK